MGVPKATTFGATRCPRYGYFRRDMHCSFDTKFGLKLAFVGELPVMIDRELALQVVHFPIADPRA
jgi:hypothetical protein